MANLPPNDTTSASSLSGNASVSEQKPFSIARVFQMVLVIVLIAGVGYGGWTLLHSPPVLMPFTGRVTYKGNPVTSGGIATMRLDDQLDSATAPLDEEGRFSLQTNGEPGAYIGRHKIVISSMTPTMPPTPLIPGIYGSMATTPLKIDVSRDPAKNTMDINLEGELPGAGGAPSDNDTGDQKTADPAEELEKTSAKPE